ncbi:hypothetical protein CAC42_2109 [Sphaceloma murrayae]|uniref:Ribosomal RNA-processing protein 43 n=1 Tax=Sphaceloma murrayae TaxID=2082308 RepID=A0A2K1QJ10_9PEZI|nr:hypothetical protein CAC42_2109 [Sphaceloma murrayae]
MATSSAPSLSPLSFPAATFAKLTPEPYLLAHLQPSDRKATPTRPSGRSPLDYRAPQIHSGSLSHSNGSAVVRLGATSIVCGIRGEILRAQDIPHPYRPYTTSSSSPSAAPENNTEISDLSLLVPNLELSTGCSPSHLPGNPPSPVAQSLTHRLLSLLHSTSLVPPSSLRITTTVTEDEETQTVTKAYWALYIDVLVISHDGNVFDAAWLAILAALRDTRLPKAEWDADNERVVCDPKRDEARGLGIGELPIACSFGVFENGNRIREEEGDMWILADCDAFEEGVVREGATLVVDDGAVKKVELGGGQRVGREGMRKMVEQAGRRAGEWRKIVQDAGKSEDS